MIERCRRIFSADDENERLVEASIIADLTATRDHLTRLEQRDLGEWIRDLPAESIGDFLAGVTARQADSDSDIGSFISALADWQTTADATTGNKGLI